MTPPTPEFPWPARLVIAAAVAALHGSILYPWVQGKVVRTELGKLEPIEVRLVEALPRPDASPPVPPTASPSAPPRPAPPSTRSSVETARPKPPSTKALASQATPGPVLSQSEAAPASISAEPSAAVSTPSPTTVSAAPTEPTRMAIGVACPVQAKPVMPARAMRDGIEGMVTARITLRAGKVVHIDIVQAQPTGLFERAVRDAVMQYRCESTGDVDVVATQTFDFKLQ